MYGVLSLELEGFRTDVWQIDLLSSETLTAALSRNPRVQNVFVAKVEYRELDSVLGIWCNVTRFDFVFHSREDDVPAMAINFVPGADWAVGDRVVLRTHVDGGCDMEVLFEKTGWDTSGDVVGLPDGLLYWTIRGTTSDVLVTVDPVTKAESVKGDVGFERLFGVGYDQGQGRLYGFSASGEVIEINASTGAGSLLTQDATRAWWGATTNPVVWTP